MSHRPHQKNGDKLRFSRRVTGLYIIQLRPSVQGNIQICQPEGENNPLRVDKSGCFPTQRAVFVLLYFCQCFIGYLPCGGKLGCSARNNRVVRQGTIGLFPGSANFCQCFICYMYLPCGGKLGCLAGNNMVVSQQCKFWQNISIILLSHD